MDKAGDTEPPCTVTASYSIKLRRPTPMGSTLIVKGEVTEIGDDRANVKMSLSADGEVCATGTGLFVAVKEGHPAFHRWINIHSASFRTAELESPMDDGDEASSQV